MVVEPAMTVAVADVAMLPDQEVEPQRALMQVKMVKTEVATVAVQEEGVVVLMMIQLILEQLVGVGLLDNQTEELRHGLALGMEEVVEH